MGLKESTFKEISNVISEKRKELGLTNTAFAKSCGVSVNTINSIQRGMLPDLRSNQQRAKWGKSISGIAIFCKIEPDKWLAPLKLRFIQKKVVFDSWPNLLDSDFTTKDAQFLFNTSQGLLKPMTVRMVLELLQHRRS